MYTSLEPRVCDVSHELILDYEYYTYEKRGCDISLESWENTDDAQLPYSRDKFVLESVPERLRVVYWRNPKGQIRFISPTKTTLTLTLTNPNPNPLTRT